MKCNMQKLLFDKIKLILSAFFCVLILSVFIVLIIAFVIFPYQYHHGLNWKGIGYKYYFALKSGNAKEAIHWAKRGYAYEILGKGGQIRNSERFIAQAYELDGQYEMAINWYKIAGKGGFPAPRLYYKMGRLQESFEAYCRYAEAYAERHAEDLASKAWNVRNLALGRLRMAIIMESVEMRLTAFVDYADFVAFMEAEYEKAGEPEKYKEAMELYRSVETEIDEKHAPTSGMATDDFQKMRDEIREERKKK